MKSFWRRTLKGLATVLPFFVTLYIVFWILGAVEALFGGLIRLMLPDKIYFKGMGVLAAPVLLYFIGGMVEKKQIVHRLSDWLETVIEKVPVVKTIYSSARDMMQFLSLTKEGKEGARQVVLVRQGDVQLLGFVTGEETEHLGDLPEGAEDRIAVFIPMSYQVGGLTVYLPRSSVQPLDMSVEEAMRIIMSAGMAKTGGKR
jgi:uncharacterized membrane protein